MNQKDEFPTRNLVLSFQYTEDQGIAGRFCVYHDSMKPRSDQMPKYNSETSQFRSCSLTKIVRNPLSPFASCLQDLRTDQSRFNKFRNLRTSNLMKLGLNKDLLPCSKPMIT